MITEKIVATWLYSLMTAVSPPDRMAAVPQLPGWEESAPEKEVRYQAIALELTRTVYDPEVEPLFAGPRGRAETAALVLAVAFHESGFAHDVDRGPCAKVAGKAGQRCDGGASACLMQLRIGAGTTLEGWTREELFADRQKCFRAGLRLMRRSLTSCRALLPNERLAVYAGGSCRWAPAVRASRELFAQEQRFLARGPLPGPDSEMMAAREALPEAVSRIP